MSDEYRWSPQVPSSHEHAWTRVYRQGAREAHISELIYSAHPRAPGSWDSMAGWYGTGSQEEYDTAKSMRLCPRCFVAMVQHEI